jgi:hypothetical protein
MVASSRSTRLVDQPLENQCSHRGDHGKTQHAAAGFTIPKSLGGRSARPLRHSSMSVLELAFGDGAMRHQPNT